MTKRLLMYCGIGVGMTLLWAFLIWHPAVSEHHSKRSDTARLERQLNDLLAIVVRIPEYTETRKALMAEAENLQSTLYAKNEIMEMLDLLDREASRNGLKITEITPPVDELLDLNRTTRPDEPLFLNITLAVEGRYVGFGRYVNQLEKAAFFRGVNHCHIVRPREDDRPLNISLGFKTLLGRVRETS